MNVTRAPLHTTTQGYHSQDSSKARLKAGASSETVGAVYSNIWRKCSILSHGEGKVPMWPMQADGGVQWAQ